MANIIKQITLTEKGLSAGPYFDVYYSLDCVNYILATNGNSVYLPNIGSNVNVIVDDGLQCLKVVNTNNSSKCFFNSQVQTFTTTTTTTTTAAPTTTTTTLAPIVMYQVAMNGGRGTRTFSYLDFNRTLKTTSVNTNLPLNNFIFAAIKNSVSFNSGLDGTATIITDPLVPQFDYDRVLLSPPQLNNLYANFQNDNGDIIQLGERSYDANWCIVNNTFQSNNSFFRIQYIEPCSGQTTTTTAGPTTTTTSTACTLVTFDGNITHAGLTAYWTDCDGTARSQFVPADTTYGPVCARTGTAQGQAFTTSGPCIATIRVSDSLTTVCSGGGSSVTTITYTGGTTICNATSISATSFITLGVGNYYVYDPLYGYSQYYKSTGAGVGTSMDKVGFGCSSCPTTTTTTTPSKNLSWNYTISGGAGGNMIIYLNGNVIENRNSNSSGTWPLSTGDQIYFEVFTSGCSGGSIKANSYTIVPGVPSYAILADASCANNSTTLTTGTYTVQSSDTTISVGAYSLCDSGCV